jgi:hypothetical protein
MARNKQTIEAIEAVQLMQDEGLGSERKKLAKTLEASGNPLAQAFADMTPAQRAWGQLTGKIYMATSYDAIEEAFTWFEGVVKDKPLSWRDKMLALFQAAELLECDAQTYRLIRKMYLTGATAR